MKSQSSVLVTVLFGKAASAAAAAEVAGNSQGCPYVVSYQSHGTLVTGLFVLPVEKRWWIETPQARPELLGLEQVELFFAERISAESPWSLGQVRPEAEVAPCGSRCDRCPEYQGRCRGCPATYWAR